MQSRAVGWEPRAGIAFTPEQHECSSTSYWSAETRTRVASAKMRHEQRFINTEGVDFSPRRLHTPEIDKLFPSQ